MTFTWKTPPWLRNEDCTHTAVLVADSGGGQISFNTQSVRGDDATEALADLLMGPGGANGTAVLLPGLVAVVVRRGIDMMWMAQPPIEVSAAGNGELSISVSGAQSDEVTAFSAADAQACSSASTPCTALGRSRGGWVRGHSPAPTCCPVLGRARDLAAQPATGTGLNVGCETG
ncbi:hypothetical protein [Streptomyces halstedii]|uniref:Uncharacterized protein n=1 Tax=Streptomyces halstedii TaxID=1944 RepID=A0A6N9UDE1_STRHA|nr:hypothetical protein [Streptomyces halstedii]NEA20659.1 hypothetical protein [Streptomyces halstedii]